MHRKRQRMLKILSSRCLWELRKTKKRKRLLLRHRIKAQRTTKIESQQINLISSFFSSFLLSFLSLFFCLFLPSCILLLFFTSFLPSFVLSFFMCIQLPQLISKMTQIKIRQSWNYHYLESDIFLWREEELSCGMFGSAPGIKQQDARRIFSIPFNFLGL